MAIYDNRVCKECGQTFSGGPRAWYCPECRVERQRRQARHPSKRPIGSKDICQNCGKKYIVNSGLQKYCPDCQPIMHKELDNRQGKSYYHKKYESAEKRSERSERRRVQYDINKDEINRKRREKYKNKKASPK